MCDGLAERMVGTIKRIISETIINKQHLWTQTTYQILFSYKCREKDDPCSPFKLLYEVQPDIFNENYQPFMIASTLVDIGYLELLDVLFTRAKRNLRSIDLQEKVAAEKVTTYSER